MILLLIGIALILLVDLILFILWLVNFKSSSYQYDSEPLVSILIAARNEELNLPACLDSLVQLNYPVDKLNILIGDDDSDDQTWDLLTAYSIRYPHIKCFKIRKHTIKGNAKANVLAYLAKQATGKFLFLTDADISVPANWIKRMLNGMIPGVALVTGTSVVTGNGIMSYMQQLEWLFATGMLKTVSDLGIAVTTMGNNMLLRRDVYDEIGGYEEMPFSITEDLELFNHVKKRYKTVNLFEKDVLNRAKPLHSLIGLLSQRKRWMKGAFKLPIMMVSILVIQSMLFPVMIILVIFSPTVALEAFILHFLLRYSFIFFVARKLEERINIIGSFAFEIYGSVFSFVSILYYFFSGPVNWKGREY